MSQNQPTASLKSWALPRLQPLLPLPEEDLLEAISYASTLPSAGEVGTHFKDFLGESTESLSFISEFNSRLFPQATTSRESTTTTTSRGGGKQGKKSKPALSKYTQAPRQANDGIGGQFGNAVYMKGEIEDEYFTGSTGGSGNSRRPSPNPLDSKNTSSKPSPPSAAAASSSSSSSKPTAVAGTLTSDLINIKTKKPHSKPPTQKTISLTGGTPMRGLTSELSDLESALRALEITTNPTLNSSSPSSLEERKCDCMGTKHELLIAAPNCLFCGKIICIKEGLGACTFCGKPLITAAEVQDMVRSLRSERGKERMAQNAADNKRPDVSKIPRPFSTPPTTTSNTAGGADDASLAHATAHRDKLLTYQATSAQRTKIIDQASDFETPLSSNGLNPWATPQERALQLKKQQKVMRKMEWSAKDDYEKRRVVVAIDLKGRKVVREMRAVEMPDSEDDEGDGGGGDGGGVEIDRKLEKGGENAFLGSGKGGMFSRNPLLKGMVKPIYKPPSAGGSEDPVREGEGEGYKSAGGWRKVQDEMKDNEEIILNGGAQAGGRAEAENLGEEPGCG